jgi:hypothetical protein
MRWILVWPLVMVCGCSAYTQTQMRLVEEARRGLLLTRCAQEERAVLVERLHELERRRLDEAFDADVRSQRALEADWVIEARRAYAAAMDALANQRQASREAQAAAQRNLDDIDAALERVLVLQGVQLKLMEWPERR